MKITSLTFENEDSQFETLTSDNWSIEFLEEDFYSAIKKGDGRQSIIIANKQVRIVRSEESAQ